MTPTLCEMLLVCDQVHRNFLAAWNVTAVSVPLFDMNLSDVTAALGGP